MYSNRELTLSSGTVVFIKAICMKLWRATRSYPLLVINDEQMLSCNTQHVEVKL